MRRYRGTLYVAGYQDEVMELSETAAFIWRHVDGVRTVHDIAELVAREYDVPLPDALADLGTLLGELRSAGVLHVGAGT